MSLSTLFTPLLFLSLTFSSFFSALVHAESSVWSVSNGKNTIYLAGTFHLLKPSDYPLPTEFEKAYKEVNWLVFETSIKDLESQNFQQKFRQAMTLPQGQTLQGSLSASAYKALSDYCNKENIPLADFSAYKPQMIGLIMTMHELRKLGMTAQGVDDYFSDKADADKKIVTQLESIEQQIEFISTMGAGNESNLILQSLQDVETLPKDMAIMSEAWRTGNRQALTAKGIKPMQDDYPRIYRSLLVDRNYDWLPKIERLLKHPEKKLIMVGALHLIGEDGLLTLLQNKGYRIDQYQ